MASVFGAGCFQTTRALQVIRTAAFGATLAYRESFETRQRIPCLFAFHAVAQEVSRHGTTIHSDQKAVPRVWRRDKNTSPVDGW